MAERARILLIDDDPDLRHITSCLLEEAGYSVSDDGAGLPPGLILDQPPSLGLRLVTMLTQQLGGRLELVRDAGTAFKITFPHTGRNCSEEAGQ